MFIVQQFSPQAEVARLKNLIARTAQAHKDSCLALCRLFSCLGNEEAIMGAALELAEFYGSNSHALKDFKATIKTTNHTKSIMEYYDDWHGGLSDLQQAIQTYRQPQGLFDEIRHFDSNAHQWSQLLTNLSLLERHHIPCMLHGRYMDHVVTASQVTSITQLDCLDLLARTDRALESAGRTLPLPARLRTSCRLHFGKPWAL